MNDSKVDKAYIKQAISELNHLIKKDNQNIKLRIRRAEQYIYALDHEDDLVLYEDDFWFDAHQKVHNDLTYIDRKGVPSDQLESFYKLFVEFYISQYWNPQEAYKNAQKYYDIAHDKSEAIFYLMRICSLSGDRSLNELALEYNDQYLSLPNVDYAEAIKERISILTKLKDYAEAFKIINEINESNICVAELMKIKYSTLLSRLQDNFTDENYRNEFFAYGLDYLNTCLSDQSFRGYFNWYFYVYDKKLIPLNDIYDALVKLEKIYGVKEIYFCQWAKYYEKNNDLQSAIRCYEKASEVGAISHYEEMYKLYSIIGNKEQAAEAFNKIGSNTLSEWDFANKVIFSLHGYHHDFDLGFRLAKEHADKNPDSECALRLLALCYEDGLGVQKDLVKAYELYRNGMETKGNCGCSALGYILCKLYGSGTKKDITEAKRLFKEVEKKIVNRYTPEAFARITLESPDDYFTYKKAIRKLVEKEKRGSTYDFASDLFLLLYRLSKSTKKKNEYKEKFKEKYSTDNEIDKRENARFFDENDLDLPLFVSNSM